MNEFMLPIVYDSETDTIISAQYIPYTNKSLKCWSYFNQFRIIIKDSISNENREDLRDFCMFPDCSHSFSNPSGTHLKSHLSNVHKVLDDEEVTCQTSTRKKSSQDQQKELCRLLTLFIVSTGIK